MLSPKLLIYYLEVYVDKTLETLTHRLDCYCITKELILTLSNILLVVIPQENLFCLFHNTNIIKIF